MPDIASITAVLNGLKAATDIAKFIKEADYSLETADLKLRIAELVSSLADAKIAIAEVQDALRDKEAEIERLKKALELKAELVRHNDAYYETDNNGNPTGAPYCSHCFERNHVAVHINQNPKDRRTSVCPSCKNVFGWQRNIVPQTQ